MSHARRRSILLDRKTPDIVVSVFHNKHDALASDWKRLCETLPPQCPRYLPLHLAASLGRTDICRRFVREFDVKVNVRCGDLLTPLHRACRNDRDETVRELLLLGADVNSRSKSHHTPLHICAMFNAYNCAKVLFSSGPEKCPNPDFADSAGSTPLHHAIVNQSSEMIAFLLQHDAQVNLQDKYGQRALHYAAMFNDSSVINAILKRTQEINVRNKQFMTPLHCAIATEQFDAFNELLRLGADVEMQDSNGNLPIHWAAYVGNKPMFELLLERCPEHLHSSNHLDQRPIHLSVISQNNDNPLYIEFIQKTLLTEPDIRDKFGCTPLHYAALSGAQSLVEVLLDSGATIDSLDSNLDTPFHLAVRESRHGAITVLMSRGVPLDLPNKNGQTPLHLAIFYGQPWISKRLVDAGVNFRVLDCHGRSPQFYTAYKGDLDSFFRLLPSAEDKDSQVLYPRCDAKRLTMFHIAASSPDCQLEFLKFFLELASTVRSNQDATSLSSPFPADTPSATLERFNEELANFDFNATDLNGWTILHHLMFRPLDFSLFEFPSVIENLIELDLKINVLDNRKCLAFHYAVKNGHSRLLYLLMKSKWLKNPVKYDLYFGGRRCPLVWAAYFGQPDCLNVLIDMGFYNNLDQALKVAVRKNYQHCVDILASFVDPGDLLDAFTVSIKMSHLNSLRCLADALNAPPESLERFLLGSASLPEDKSFPVFEYLHMNSKVSLHCRDKNGRNALFYAVIAQNRKIVSVLLRNDVDFTRRDVNGQNIFHLCASHQLMLVYDELIQILLQNGKKQEVVCLLKSRDQSGASPLEVCMKLKHNQLLAWMLELCPASYGRTLLFYAAYVGNIDYLKNFVKKCPTFDVVQFQSNNGRYLLHYAAMGSTDNSQFIRFMVEDMNFNVDKRDQSLADGQDGYLPIFYAAIYGNVHNIQALMLYEHSFEKILHITDGQNNSILHLVCMSGNEKAATLIWKWFHEFGLGRTVLSMKNLKEQTPLHIAAMKSLTNLIVEFAFNTESMNDPDVDDYTPLMHCASDRKAAFTLFCLHEIIVEKTKFALESSYTNSVNNSSSQQQLEESSSSSILNSTPSNSDLRFNESRERIRRSLEMHWDKRLKVSEFKILKIRDSPGVGDSVLQSTNSLVGEDIDPDMF